LKSLIAAKGWLDEAKMEMREMIKNTRNAAFSFERGVYLVRKEWEIMIQIRNSPNAVKEGIDTALYEVGTEMENVVRDIAQKRLADIAHHAHEEMLAALAAAKAKAPSLSNASGTTNAQSTASQAGGAGSWNTYA